MKHLKSYSPNSPRLIRRKISDVQSSNLQPCCGGRNGIARIRIERVHFRFHFEIFRSALTVADDKPRRSIPRGQDHNGHLIADFRHRRFRRQMPRIVIRRKLLQSRKRCGSGRRSRRRRGIGPILWIVLHLPHGFGNEDRRSSIQ